jgi:hypothetical protein
MADIGWIFVERRDGRVVRVTTLDHELRVLGAQDRETACGAQEIDDTQLLRVADLEQLTL